MTKRVWTCAVMALVVLTATFCVGWGKRDRTTDELIKIGMSGAGMVLDASGRDASELTKIAMVYGSGGGTLYLKNCGGMETADLVKIGMAGSGHVVIEF